MISIVTTNRRSRSFSSFAQALSADLVPCTGLSKLANVLATKELQWRFEREKVNATAPAVRSGT